MELSSNLQGKSQQEIIEAAHNVACNSFIKNGNRAVPFTENNELRLLVGGQYSSYEELSKLIITAYNQMQCDLILANM